MFKQSSTLQRFAKKLNKNIFLKFKLFVFKNDSLREFIDVKKAEKNVFALKKIIWIIWCYALETNIFWKSFASRKDYICYYLFD